MSKRKSQRKIRRGKMIGVAVTAVLFTALLAIAMTVLWILPMLGLRDLRGEGGTDAPPRLPANFNDFTEETTAQNHAGIDSGNSGTGSGEKENNQTPATDAPPTTQDPSNGEGGDRVRYNGQLYQYNTQVVSVLFMGVDSNDEIQDSYIPGAAHQADTLFLMVFDTYHKTVRFLAIPRDTMAEITAYNRLGTISTMVKEQICRAHAYGSNAQQCSELTVEAVSRLLYQVSINSYCTLYMNAIPTLMESIGEIQVTLSETLEIGGETVEKGSTYTIQPSNVMNYLRARTHADAETGSRRQARQIEFLTLAWNQFRDKLKADVTLPVKLYQKAANYIQTDLTTNRMLYFATSILGMQVDTRALTLSGEYQLRQIDEQTAMAEFYPSALSIMQALISLYYIPIDG